MKNRIRRATLLAVLLCPALSFAAHPAERPPVELTLQECVALALRNNLAVLLAKAGSASARGKALQSAAELLPRFTGSLMQMRTFAEDLPAMGFGGFGKGFPETIGPWNTFDARVRLVQEIFNLPSALRLKSADADERAAGMEEALAAEQVVAAAVLAYVELFRSRQAIAAAQADVELATSLRQLAEDKKGAGTAAGIDVARAKTREAERRLALLEARNVAQEAEVRLQRVAGLPLDRGVVLKDEPGFAPGEPFRVDEAVASAQGGRWEMRIATQRLEAARSQWRAEQFMRAPSVVLSGDVGLSGLIPDYRDRTTGSVGAALQLPLFTGRAIEGRVREADGRRAAAEARLEDLRARIEEDVRLALIDLSAGVERVGTATEVERLAEDELAMARDRFAAGWADNVELLDSQAALTHARDTRVAALARFQVARINFALAMGQMGGFRF